MSDPYSRNPDAKIVSNPDLSELHDKTSPTLTSLVLLETMKWGSILLVIFVLFSFAEPLWSPIIEYFSAESPADQAAEQAP